MTHKVARNTREILNKQEAISVLLEISQCFMQGRQSRGGWGGRNPP